MEVVGYSEYTAVSPASITFTAANWDTPQYITVSMSAATNERPVCPNGKLYCDDLTGRSELLFNPFNSSDVNYNGFVGVINATATVTYDNQKAPKPTSAKFSDVLNSILLEFDSDTNKGGLSGSFSCSEILDGSSATDTYLGDGSYCSFSDANTLTVTFGTEPTIVTSDTLTLKNSTIQSSDDAASLFSHYNLTVMTVAVGYPDNPVNPVVVMASPDSIGACDPLTLDGSMTSGSGGRAMTYEFSVTGSEERLENITRVFNATTGHSVTIPNSEFFMSGARWEGEFTLTACNFLPACTSFSKTITKLSRPAPNLMIVGEHPAHTTYNKAVSIRAEADLPNVECVAVALNNHMDFYWSELTGKYTGSFDTRSPRVLNIDAMQLTPKETYEFQVVAVMTHFPTINNTATLEVVVDELPVVAGIANGVMSEHGTDDDLVLVCAQTHALPHMHTRTYA